MQNKYKVQINKLDKGPFIKAVAPIQAKYKNELGADLVDGIAKLGKITRFWRFPRTPGYSHPICVSEFQKLPLPLPYPGARAGEITFF